MRRQRTYEHHTRRRSLKGLAGGLLAGILFAACQGDNLFVDFTGTGSVQDGEIPVVNIQQPSSASAAAIPLGDSVLVTADIRDDAGVSRVVFEGISSRGDPALGTDSAVLRFVSKTVDFVPPVPDTTISRYLLALPDTVLETTQIIVTAFDTVGNSAADTLSLILGGPEVLFTNLVGGEVIQSGATLGLRVQARDGAGVRQVEITVTGITGVGSLPYSHADLTRVGFSCSRYDRGHSGWGHRHHDHCGPRVEHARRDRACRSIHGHRDFGRWRG